MLCQDIKSLDSSREDRIKYFERHIAELQKSAKQNVDKIEKQREKTEQAQVEVEVLRNELLQMEGKEQDSVDSWHAVFQNLQFNGCEMYSISLSVVHHEILGMFGSFCW